MIGRRNVLAGIAIAIPVPWGRVEAAVPRLAVLDWGLAATVLALGITPIGVPAIPFYNRNVVDPAMPAQVVDVGLLFTPNFELLLELAPDRILVTPALLPARDALEQVAPLVIASLVSAAGDQYQQARAATMALAKALGREAAGLDLVARTDVIIERLRKTLSEVAHRPVCLINLLDGRHIRIFGSGTLYQSVLDRLGLVNAWHRPSTFVPVGVETLADLPEASIIVIGSPADLANPAILGVNPFWNALPAVRAGRVQRISSVLVSGGIPAAGRLAQMLGSVLLAAND